MVVVVVCSLWFGCITPDYVDCEDGTICPAGNTCSPGGCRAEEQIQACADRADGDPCTLLIGPGECELGACIVARCGNSIVEPGEVCDDGNQFGGDRCNGTCSSDEGCGNGLVELAEECDCGTPQQPGAVTCKNTVNGGEVCSTLCILQRCGDGVVGPLEVCDDGNTIAGDGCSFDCKSNESCGNGTLDYFAGEQCDDDNARNRDGCSAGCQDETIAWSSPTSSVPLARYGAMMAYDAARDRVVMFGGASGFRSDETLELEGNAWYLKTPTTSPPARSFGAMAYDAARGRVVLFGGEIGLGRADTWTYDGTTWTEVMASTAPPAREDATMAYDAARERIVLFGGFTMGAFELADTWEFDGATWVLMNPAARPPARRGAMMTYDAARGRIVVFGGVPAGAGRLGDTWEFDGTTWTERVLSPAPPARDRATLSYDASRRKSVLFGGTNGVTNFNDTWELDATGWTQRSAATSPSVRFAGAMAGARGRVVLFGGTTAIPGAIAAETWTYNGTTWSQPAPTVAAPPPRMNAAYAYDAARGRFVVFGGENAGNDLGDTWELGTNGWIQRVLAPAPTPRTGGELVYDEGRQRIVLFGGRFSSLMNIATSETWELDETGWTALSSAGGPSARAGHAMAYDSRRDRIVLYGGGAPAETWELAGSTWIRKLTTDFPGSTEAAMAYDKRRGVVVLYAVGRTYDYDGVNWTRITTPTTPPQGILHTLVYDPVRERIVMFGGIDGGGNTYGTWEFDGVTWKRIALGPAPPLRNRHAAAYHAARGSLVVFGGDSLPGYLGDTWELISSAGIRAEVCSSGIDYDHDGAAGCGDDECWGTCTPHCPPAAPAATCPVAPACGDGTCTTLETCRGCPQDCATGTAACPIRCGDFFCDSPSETLASCPGDCTP